MQTSGQPLRKRGFTRTQWPVQHDDVTRLQSVSDRFSQSLRRLRITDTNTAVDKTAADIPSMDAGMRAGQDLLMNGAEGFGQFRGRRQ